MTAKGFRIPEREVVLEFTGDYEGAEVRCALNVSMEVFLALQDALNKDGSLAALQNFGDGLLRAWNLLDKDGEPIPATGAGMKAIPVELGTMIVKAWSEAVAAPPAPLSVRSGNGATSGEESTLRLADASKSLGS